MACQLIRLFLAIRRISQETVLVKLQFGSGIVVYKSNWPRNKTLATISEGNLQFSLKGETRQNNLQW